MRSLGYPIKNNLRGTIAILKGNLAPRQVPFYRKNGPSGKKVARRFQDPLYCLESVRSSVRLPVLHIIGAEDSIAFMRYDNAKTMLVHSQGRVGRMVRFRVPEWNRI